MQGPATVEATAPPGGSATAVAQDAQGNVVGASPVVVAAPVDAQPSAKVVEYGEATPLPETGWGWRRFYVFAVTGVLLAHVWYQTWTKITDVATLREVIRNDQALIFILLLLYLAGASAEAIVRLVSAVRTSRKETLVTGPPAATVAPTVIPPPPPAAPPAGSATLAAGSQETVPPWRRTPPAAPAPEKHDAG